MFVKKNNDNSSEVMQLNIGQQFNIFKFVVIYQESGFIQFFDCDLSDESVSQLLGRKEIALFNLLFENKGVPLSRDKIMDNVWDGSIVGDNTLSVTVSKLRKALRRVDRSGDIVTLGRFGYVLNLPMDKFNIIEKGKIQLIA